MASPNQKAQAIKAHDYQLEAVAAIRAAFRSGERRVLLQLPTGAGKTVTICEMIRQMLATFPSYRVCIIVPRLSIIKSFVETVENMTGITPTVAAESSHGTNITGQIVVGSYQTLINQEMQPFHLAVADEAHKINELDKTSAYYRLVKKLTDNEETRLVALTATPFRDTGYIYGPDKMFRKPIFSRDLLWTTEQGFTVPAVLYGSKESFNVSTLSVDSTGEYSNGSLDELARDVEKARRQVADILEHTVDRRKVAIACTNIKHAELIGDLLRFNDERCVVIHSNQAYDDREESLGEFSTDDGCRFLVFVSIVAEGFDFPRIDCVVLLRPTRRANLYVQIVGRGLRPSPETVKKNCLVLDYGQVIRNCGPLNAPFVATEGGKRGLEKAQEKSDDSVIQCRGCGMFLFPKLTDTAPVCPACKTVNENTKAEEISKRLKEKAEKEAALYAKQAKRDADPHEVRTYTVKSVSFEPFGWDQLEKRKTKLIRVLVKEDPNRVLQFWVNNPNFVDNEIGWEKKAATDREDKLQKFMSDVSGSKFDIRSIEPVMSIIPKLEIQITAAVRKDFVSLSYDKYRSHVVVEKPHVNEFELDLFNVNSQQHEANITREVIDKWCDAALDVFGDTINIVVDGQKGAGD